ncbi:MAG: hypothetical protein JWN73_3921 [Betaproteobacteria bacterium]|nr:hypothetical protein [Betaproteobacteria bacterium]
MTVTEMRSFRRRITRCFRSIACPLLAIGMVAACAAPVPQRPVTIKEASPGTAVVYFFRPELDKVERGAHPLLLVDGRPVGTLEYKTYTTVQLAPGVHRVALAAGPADSVNWNQGAEFSADDGVTYFVALWHQNQPNATPDSVAAMSGIAGHLLFQFMHPPQGAVTARFESVDRPTAEFGLAGLQYVPPQDDAMAVR